MVAFTVLWSSYPIRAFLFSALVVVLTLEFLVLLMSQGREIQPSLQKELYAIGVGFVLFHGIRGGLVLFSKGFSLMSDSALTGTTFLVTIGFSVLWGGILLVLDAGRLQKQVTSHNDELLRLNRLKDRVLAMTSHDLRGPLGNLHVLWGEVTSRILAGVCSDLDIELLQMVDRSLVGTQSLLENLFSFAESQGSLSDPEARTDLSLVISIVLEQWEPAAMTKKVELRKEAGGEREARASFNAVLTVLRNVVGNAVKFTPAGGFVTVRLLVSEDGETVLEVADTGIGMTSDLLAKTLRLESRTSRPGTSGERGSGFGLVLVKELVDGWGGSFRIESVPGQGTRVKIGFPGMAKADGAR
jgi:signal transduction histidine kinase